MHCLADVAQACWLELSNVAAVHVSTHELGLGNNILMCELYLLLVD